MNCLVTEIMFEGQQPVGVRCEVAGDKDKGVFSEYAKEIIVNASVPTLAGQLLPQDRGNILSEQIKNLNIGASLLTVYYGFRRSLFDIGNRFYSTFVFDPSIKTQKDIPGNNRAGFETRSFTFVDYSQVDSALAPKGKSVGAVCCIDYASDWEALDRKSYLKKKADVAEMFTTRCENLIPGFRDALELAEVGTPMTVKRYTLNPEGAVYGFAQNPGKHSGYLQSLPENMYIASAWGKFGGGFSGSIYSGYMTALDVLRKK